MNKQQQQKVKWDIQSALQVGWDLVASLIYSLLQLLKSFSEHYSFQISQKKKKSRELKSGGLSGQYTIVRIGKKMQIFLQKGIIFRISETAIKTILHSLGHTIPSQCLYMLFNTLYIGVCFYWKFLLKLPKIHYKFS